ncbi:MAG TPA: hypothetical protein VFK05_24395 [Polyangiaceae bacterium]|nr:hypothetical protein [Polyangiaceae bacterium]
MAGMWARRSGKKVSEMSSKVVRRGLCSALGFLGLLAAGAAGAQEEAASEEKPAESASAAQAGHRQAVQLSLHGSLLDYQKQTIKQDPLPNSSTQPPDLNSSTTTFGFLGSGLGVGVGYAWDQLLFGARLQLTHSTDSPDSGNETKATSIELFPRLEYMLSSDSARPFIAALVGLQHTSSSTHGGLVTTESSSTLYGFGASFGVHAFLNRSVSIDPELAVIYAAGSESSSSLGGPAGGMTVPNESSVNALRFLFTLGLSGWLDTGGAPPPPPPHEEQTEAPPAVAAAPIVSAEPEAKPVSADIHLPNHRRLYVQVLKDPAQPFALVRLTEPRTSFALLKCDAVSIESSGEPIPLAVRTHGEHYLTGRLPIRGLETLAGIVDSSISVCGTEWQLGQESREQVQAFLKARRELLDDGGDSAPAEEQPVEATPPPAAEAPASPSAAPVAPSANAPSSPSAKAPTPSAPPAPSAPAPTPTKPAPPKK